ncbi:hypothetical protein, variant [Fonticula alba]|uniref:Protein S-acyltransferase n=1 Tax=Fonticula alba TaxID=691883 RepID=A0A058Z5L9_FONAL|nr:hypothetical protein, variant [Fonticula alba]KCV68822.1 hypothetical protein, variant [Fonticula alba]|eukprot:XP_009496393.1 hypothetical protein, variant [Fonticula alba]
MSAKAIFGALEMLFSRHRRFLNRVADKGLRALGPMLVTFAIGLLGTVTIFYFVFVVRLRYFFALGPDGTPLVPDYSRGGMPLPEMTPGRTVGLLLDLAVAVWICACMWFNFYMAIMAKSYVPMHRQEALADMLMSDLSAPAPEDLGPAEGSLGDNPAEPFLQAGRRAGPGSRDHCRRCDQARPPRSHHCSICDRCVPRGLLPFCLCPSALPAVCLSAPPSPCLSVCPRLGVPLPDPPAISVPRSTAAFTAWTTTVPGLPPVSEPTTTGTLSCSWPT